METVPFVEFKKLDIRVAKVLSVENHPNADKLYVLKIDLGGEQRQIVAGLRTYYTPEQLQGRSIVVVANLEPALLRGVESQGMLLAAQDGPKVLLLQPDSAAAPGAQVRRPFFHRASRGTQVKMDCLAFFRF